MWRYLLLMIGLTFLSFESGVAGDEIEIQEEIPVTNSEHLKDLDWLVGKWIDQDDNIDSVSTFAFDSYKNFLTQQLFLKVSGKEQIEVRQIIGWDPVKKQVRSWIFDSHGGFGEGVWTKQGDAWFVNSHFTLADGRQASAINIYKKLDNDRYTWASTGRDIDGEILPNIEPITIVRETKGGAHE